MNLARSIAYDDLSTIVKKVKRLAYTSTGNWNIYGKRLLAWLKSPTVDRVPHSVFIKGNMKLPFYSFSVLPIVTCPGAGECAEYCYSLKAWRYPQAFYRQVFNTLCIRFFPEIVEKAFLGLPSKQKTRVFDEYAKEYITVESDKPTHVRLYVDGDFDSLGTVEFWFNLLEKRPDLRVYGYSKSWVELLAYRGAFPSNYKLNLSSGSLHADKVKEAVKRLPITRGEFLAVPVEKRLAGKYDNPEYKRAVLQSAGTRGFICPGKCGTCTKKEHACGSDRFQDIPVLIGIH